MTGIVGQPQEHNQGRRDVLKPQVNRPLEKTIQYIALEIPKFPEVVGDFFESFRQLLNIQ